MVKFKCKENCGECCGIVPIPTKIWNKNEDKIYRFVEHIHGSEVFILPVTEDLKCCFLNMENKCTIYNDRPEVCRRYGQCDEIPCPYLKKNGNPWSEAKAKQIRKKINKDVDMAIKITGQNRI